LGYSIPVDSGHQRLKPATGTIGHHRLIATLGHGGMADVYLAMRQGPIELAKLQVVKRMRPELVEDPQFVAMFVDEARLAVRLNHPNVVHTTEVNEYDGGLYLAMEYLDGQPLSLIVSRARRHGGLSLALSVRIVADVLAGLHHAHELCDYDGTALRIVHRDVTPGNIFITYEGQVKLVDFGIAKAVDRAAHTQIGMLKGKAGYMAPEQLLGRDIDRRTDVFAAGVVLWELAAGTRLWPQGDATEAQAMVAEGAPSLRRMRPDLPEELERICAKALARNPDDRYSTAEEMQEDLERLAFVARLRGSGRDLAEFMGRAFPGERVAMRAVVERRIGELRREGELTVTSSLSNPAVSKTLSRKSGPRDVIPRNPALDSVPPEPTSVSMRPTLVVRKARSKTLMLVVAGATAALGMLLVVPRLGDVRSPALPASGSSSAGAETASPLPSEHPAAPIELRIVARPADALILLDGAELSGNPFAGRFPRDGVAHRVEVRANGYQTRTQTVEFSSDVQLLVTLEQAVRPERAPRPPPAAPPTASTRATPGKPRALDTSDPWR